MEQVRAATPQDLPEILSIYENARAFMRVNGNPYQWADGHPHEDLLVKDVENGNLYVLEDEELGLLCVFALLSGKDPTYARIEGAWLNDEPYLTIHRIASSGKRGGAASQCMQWAFAQHPNLRIDTHEMNLPMQKTLAKNGFVHCGTIYLENGDPRWAYQKIQ